MASEVSKPSGGQSTAGEHSICWLSSCTKPILDQKICLPAAHQSQPAASMSKAGCSPGLTVVMDLLPCSGQGRALVLLVSAEGAFHSCTVTEGAHWKGGVCTCDLLLGSARHAQGN